MPDELDQYKTEIGAGKETKVARPTPEVDDELSKYRQEIGVTEAPVKPTEPRDVFGMGTIKDDSLLDNAAQLAEEVNEARRGMVQRGWTPRQALDIKSREDVEFTLHETQQSERVLAQSKVEELKKSSGIPGLSKAQTGVIAENLMEATTGATKFLTQIQPEGVQAATRILERAHNVNFSQTMSEFTADRYPALKQAMEESLQESAVLRNVAAPAAHLAGSLPYLIGASNAIASIKAGGHRVAPWLAQILGLGVGSAAIEGGDAKDRAMAGLWGALFGGAAGVTRIAGRAAGTGGFTLLSDRSAELLLKVGTKMPDRLKAALAESIIFAAAGQEITALQGGSMFEVDDLVRDTFLGAAMGAMGPKAKKELVKEFPELEARAKLAAEPKLPEGEFPTDVSRRTPEQIKEMESRQPPERVYEEIDPFARSNVAERPGFKEGRDALQRQEVQKPEAEAPRAEGKAEAVEGRKSSAEIAAEESARASRELIEGEGEGSPGLTEQPHSRGVTLVHRDKSGNPVAIIDANKKGVVDEIHSLPGNSGAVLKLISEANRRGWQIDPEPRGTDSPEGARLRSVLARRQKPAEAVEPPKPKKGVVREEPSEAVLDAEPAKERTTGIKRAKVDPERAERGLDPVADSVRQSRPETFEKAKQEVLDNPERPYELMDSVKKDPRPLKSQEAAVLTLHRNEVHRARDKAEADGIEAQRRGDADGVADARQRAELAEENLSAIDYSLKRTGEEWSRTGTIMQTIMRQDYSLARIESRVRRAKNFEPLSEAELGQAKKLSDQLEKVTKDRDAFAKRVERLEAMREIRPKKGVAWGSKNRFVDQSAVEAARKIWNESVSTLNINPFTNPKALAAAAKIGAFHIEAGARTIASFTKKMIEEFGDEVRPHIKELWDRAQSDYVDARRLGQAKSRRRSQLKELERIEAGGEPKPKPIQVKADSELVALDAKVDMARQRVNNMVMKAELKSRPLVKKALDAVFVQPLQLVKSLKASFDDSFFGRQGIVQMLGHPIRSSKAIPASLKAMTSRAPSRAEGQSTASYLISRIFSREGVAAARMEASLRRRPLYEDAVRDGVDFVEHGTKDARQRAEDFQGRWADHIPVVAATQRAFVVTGNRFRMDAYGALAATWGTNGRFTPEQGKAIAHFINTTTGRPTFGQGATSKAIAGLGPILWAPRLAASRFMNLVAEPVWTPRGGYKGTGKVRAAAAWEYARFLAGLSVVYSLAEMGGAETPLRKIIGGEDTLTADPASTDFAKIKSGEKTSVDVVGGMSQAAVFLWRQFTGDKTTQSGETVALAGPDRPYRGDTRWDVLTDWFRFKLNPTLGAGVDYAVGENVVGEDAREAGHVVRSLTVPLALDDTWEAMKEMGVPKGMAFGMLAIMGLGMQTYERNKKKSGTGRRSKRRSR